MSVTCIVSMLRRYSPTGISNREIISIVIWHNHLFCFQHRFNNLSAFFMYRPQWTLQYLYMERVEGPLGSSHNELSPLLHRPQAEYIPRNMHMFRVLLYFVWVGTTWFYLYHWSCFTSTGPYGYVLAVSVKLIWWIWTLQWRHNERNGVSNHRRIDCLLKRLFRWRSKKIS